MSEILPRVDRLEVGGREIAADCKEMAERLCSLRIAMAERDAKILADEGDAMRARVAACRRRLLGLPKHRYV